MGLRNLANKIRLAKHAKDADVRSLLWWAELYHRAMGVQEIREMLAGKKTYIVAALVGAASVLHQLGYLDGEAYVTILGLLGAGGLATLRAGVTKSAPPS